MSNLLTTVSASHLAKAIFDADVPEEVIRELPAQTLYMVIQYNGLHSSIEVVEQSTDEQLKAIIDLDIWNRDEINETQIWEWLRLADIPDPSSSDTSGLDILAKFLKCFDLKLVSLLIRKYINVTTNEEPTDQPPAERCFSPDNGFTWLSFRDLTADQEFLLGRLVAMIFESKAEVFYQLLSIAQANTNILLEEEAYQDKEKRLAVEGIPEFAYACEINSGKTAKVIVKELVEKTTIQSYDLAVIEPLVAIANEAEIPEPLLSALKSNQQESLLEEFTLLINAGCVFFKIPFFEKESLNFLCKQIIGAINIGLESLINESGHTADKVLGGLELKKIYQVGLYELGQFRKKLYANPVEGFVSNETLPYKIINEEKYPVERLSDLMN